MVAVVVPFESEFPPESFVVRDLDPFAQLPPFRYLRLQFYKTFKEANVITGEVWDVDT